MKVLKSAFARAADTRRILISRYRRPAVLGPLRGAANSLSDLHFLVRLWFYPHECAH
jgi:hypothetical protein